MNAIDALKSLSGKSAAATKKQTLGQDEFLKLMTTQMTHQRLNQADGQCPIPFANGTVWHSLRHPRLTTIVQRFFCIHQFRPSVTSSWFGGAFRFRVFRPSYIDGRWRY